MLVQLENPELSLRRQCELLSLNRSTLYYEPAEVSAEETALMKSCIEPGCGGDIAPDGYCNTCGVKATTEIADFNAAFHTLFSD